MNLGTVEVVLLIVAVAAVLWVLRSTPRQGQNVLQRWGIAKPTEPQGELAAAYLKRRRNLYPWVLIGAIVATMLLTDLVETMRRPKQRTRTATLVERRVRDLVPAPTVDDGAVDAALRIRSVRVGVGTALLLCTGLVLSINTFEQNVVGLADPIPASVDPVSTWVEAVVFVAALFGLFGWVGLISPWRRQRLVEASA